MEATGPPSVPSNSSGALPSLRGCLFASSVIHGSLQGVEPVWHQKQRTASRPPEEKPVQAHGMHLPSSETKSLSLKVKAHVLWEAS